MRAEATPNTATSARLAIPTPWKAALTARLATPFVGCLRSITMTMVIRIRKISVGTQASARFPATDRLSIPVAWA